jgi:hypothetical protein
LAFAKVTNLFNHIFVNYDERGNLYGLDVSEIDEKDVDGIFVGDFTTVDPGSKVTIFVRRQVNAPDVNVVPESYELLELESSSLQ